MRPLFVGNLHLIAPFRCPVYCTTAATTSDNSVAKDLLNLRGIRFFLPGEAIRGGCSPKLQESSCSWVSGQAELSNMAQLNKKLGPEVHGGG